jgi:hypothetical protein
LEIGNWKLEILNWGKRQGRNDLREKKMIDNSRKYTLAEQHKAFYMGSIRDGVIVSTTR